MSSKSEAIIGYPVSTDSQVDCVARIASWIGSGAKGKYFVCANPHSLVVAGSDDYFSESIKSADLVTPDGVGVVIASKILGGSIRERITGSDIFYGLMAALNKESGCRVFFLGSSEETLAKIESKAAVDYPHIEVATYSPPFKQEFSDEDNQRMIEAVNDFKPHVLWIGMTAPKQEKWIYQNREKLDVNFLGAIGAVFDFYVGNIKRSHPFFQKVGLEWLPRLIQEPGRLWRRNFISNPLFMLKVLKSKFSL